MQTKTLKIMTVQQLARHIALSLNYKRIWESNFPTCDFCITDTTFL